MSQGKIWVSLACCTLILAITAIPALSQNQNPIQEPVSQPGNLPELPASPPANQGAHPTTPPVASGDSNAFLNKAIEINSAEVQLGRLAAIKTENDHVKTYANMLVKDHSAALERLQHLQAGNRAGKSSNVTLSSEHEKLRTRLSGLGGAEFDREYIGAMVAGHREAVVLFEKQISLSATPADINKAAREMLPTIKQHLEQAEQIQKGLSAPAKPAK